MKVLKCIWFFYLGCMKFMLGWAIWSAILIVALVFNLVCWNWKETYDLDMEVIITGMCGEGTWRCMFPLK